jgi:hypothetical protein
MADIIWANQTSPVPMALLDQHMVQNVALATAIATSQIGLSTTGTSPNYTLTPATPITSYVAGQTFYVVFNAPGTTGSNTISVSGLAAQTLNQYNPDGTKGPGIVTTSLAALLIYDGVSFIIATPILSQSSKIQPVTATVASNALTIGLNPTTLDFRSATLTNGIPNTVTIGTALSLVIPSGATLGTVSATQARLIFLVLYNAGTPVLGVINLSGGNNLDETTLISSTAISAGATSNNVVYTTSPVTNSSFRVGGFCDITETTAGTWATAPTTVQGIGGQALAAMQSLGFGQTVQTVSRVNGTTYYNTTGKPIFLSIFAVASPQTYSISVNGVLIGSSTITTSTNGQVTAIALPGASFVYSYGGTVSIIEIR